MSLSEAMAYLTSRIKPVLANRKPEYHQLLESLAKFPEWVAAGDLTSWEGECGNQIDALIPPNVSYQKLEEYDWQLHLLSEIYELGGINLYTRYHPELTENCYQNLLEDFRKYEVPETGPSIFDVSKW